MLVVPVSEINCRDSRIEYNSNNAIILCNVLYIHLQNSANIANFFQIPASFLYGKKSVFRRYIYMYLTYGSIPECRELKIRKRGCFLCTSSRVSTPFRRHNGSAHAKRRRHCTLYSYRKINSRDSRIEYNSSNAVIILYNMFFCSIYSLMNSANIAKIF